MPDSLLAFRRFVDAIGFHETLANVRDLLSSRVARAGMLDGQNIAKSTSLSIEAVEEGQKNIELLEILIVTLYSVEMLHIVMGLLGDSKFVEVRIVCALGGLIALVVWIGMAFAKAKRPKQTRRWHPWDLIPVLTLLFLAVGFAATFQPWTAMYEKLVGKEQVPPTTLQAPPDPVKQK